MKIVLRLLPYLILSSATILLWAIFTWTDNYAWFPKGKELLMLDISLTTIFWYKVLFWLTVLNLGLFSVLNSFTSGKKWTSIITGLITGLIFWFGGQGVDKELADQYYLVFLNQSVSEEYIDRPILEGGYHMGPRLTEYILGKHSRYRRYAIGGLGKIKYKPATEVLGNILNDKTEPDVVRADCFLALTGIGTEEAKQRVDDFKQSGDREVLHLVTAWSR